MRFTLLDLLGIVAYCGVMSYCVARVGYDSPTFWTATLLAAITGLIAVFGFRRERGRGWTWLVGMPANVVFLCAGGSSLALLLNFVFLMIASAWFAWTTRPSWRTACTVVLACHSLAWSLAVWSVEPDMRERNAMRERFPIESLASRLAYEGESDAEFAISPNRDTVEGLAREALAELNEDDELSAGRRGRELTWLHRGTYERFVRSAGFGVFRMPYIGRYSAEFADSGQLADITFDADQSPSRRGWWFEPSFMRINSPSDYHRASRRDFLHPDGFGAILEPRTRVAGFVPHGFRTASRDWGHGAESWQLQRLELVSLLKFESPRVYVLDHLPRMDQLSSLTAPTRPLDEFEVEALAKLALATDVVTDERPDEIRMLGSLRASKPCLACHAVRHGALLGAFSYSLRRP